MCLLNRSLLFSQVSINTDGSAADSSAMFDVKSNTKGVLFPRMTLAELNSISSPADGLLVFCTDCGTNGLGAMAMFLAGTWLQLSTINCLTPPPAPAEGIHVPSPTQIIWEWDAVFGSTGYKWSVTNDFVTAEEMGAFTSKTETGLPPITTYTRYAWAYNSCGNSTAITLTSTTTGSGWVCGYPILINHIAGDVAPVTKTVTYSTVTNIPGENSKCWITSNLGADHQATAVNDATEASAGWYWQFNRMQGYKYDGTTVTPAWTITSIVENSDWIAANDPCALELGTGWRLPTSTEWNNVVVIGGWENWNGPWNSALKIHAAGWLQYSDGLLFYRGLNGRYWSSSQSGNSYGWYMYFASGDCSMDLYLKPVGFTGRCLRDF
jgi:hypothetical protein